jgi:SAM-dependent methyltransferase
LPPAYFDAIYARDPDPWDFAGSDYEHAKYRATVDALGQERARDAVEIGCSIGILTTMLAPRCDRLLAVDVSQAALDQARRRVAGLPNVTVQRCRFPRDAMPGIFDLLVLSEVAYYLDTEDLGRASARIRDGLAPGGRVLLVHWLGETDYPKTGDGAVDELRLLVPFLTVERTERCSEYRLDVWRR